MLTFDVRAIFNSNVARCADLLESYDALTGTGAGRRPVGAVDVLRSAVIFLHASVEELLRSVERIRLPKGPTEGLRFLRFAPRVVTLQDESKEKLTLAELAEFRGHTVDDVLANSIERHLERSNYNTVDEVAAALVRVGFNVAILGSTGARLASMIKRRHWIAHRADRNAASGSGHHAAQSLSRKTVEVWLEAVSEFGENVIGQLEGSEATSC